MTPLEIVAFVLLSLLVVAILAAAMILLWEAARLKRVIERLEQTPCPVCQQPFCSRAVQDARERQANVLTEPSFNAEMSGERPWELICTHCHSTLMFDARKFAWLEIKHPHEAE